jgi:hypothetical protein
LGKYWRSDDTEAFLPWEVDQHREAGRALDERADRRTFKADEQVTFPVAGNGAVLGLGGAFADEHVGGDVSPGSLSCPGPRYAQRPSGPQAGNQLALQRAAPLDVESLVDRLVADPHGLIFGEVDLESLRDLFGAPALHPPPVASMRLVAARPRRAGRPDRMTSAVPDVTGEPVLHVRTEPCVRGQLRWLRASGAALGVPLRERPSILETERSCRRVAP